ncbi:MAG: M81 family metallopeptidase [Alphaproteobacteria bacterium]|nr:M81 family metallopeptidase [Alphaproteobacteria bacterium]MCY4319377.1 M81 family metallopeptidase [Alphaproteobacteria bacterium]
MKVFIACLGTETNTFSSMPTGMRTFEDTMLFHGNATRHPASAFSLPLHVWRTAAEQRQGQVVESLAAFAQPAGLTVRKVYEGFRDEILRDLRAALPVDIVLLSMHGAMTAEGYEDCEGDLLACVREIVGPDVPVGGELDLHCSLTPKMVENADALVIFKEYPHIDVGERAAELFDICLAAHQGEARPVMAIHDCRMVGMWRTPVEPMRSLVAEMQAAEGRDGILSISFAHGFPWQDVPGTTAKILVVTDGDADLAARTAQAFGQKIWDLRGKTGQDTATIDEALDLVEAGPGPVVLADIADNAGGGAPSDSTFLLARALERGITGLLSGYYWDPVAVRFCDEAGVGATLRIRVGGKCGPDSGWPVDLTVTVNRILKSASQSFGNATMGMGTAVWLSSDAGIDLIVNSARTQVFHPDGMTQLGINPAGYKGIAVKSTQHFYAGFAPIASRIVYVACNGAIPPDFATIPYKRFTAPYWPRVEIPHED